MDLFRLIYMCFQISFLIIGNIFKHLKMSTFFFLKKYSGLLCFINSSIDKFSLVE